MNAQIQAQDRAADARRRSGNDFVASASMCAWATTSSSICFNPAAWSTSAWPRCPRRYPRRGRTPAENVRVSVTLPAGFVLPDCDSRRPALHDRSATPASGNLHLRSRSSVLHLHAAAGRIRRTRRRAQAPALLETTPTTTPIPRTTAGHAQYRVHARASTRDSRRRRRRSALARTCRSSCCSRSRPTSTPCPTPGSTSSGSRRSTEFSASAPGATCGVTRGRLQLRVDVATGEHERPGRGSRCAAAFAANVSISASLHAAADVDYHQQQRVPDVPDRRARRRRGQLTQPASPRLRRVVRNRRASTSSCCAGRETRIVEVAYDHARLEFVR